MDMHWEEAGTTLMETTLVQSCQQTPGLETLRLERNEWDYHEVTIWDDVVFCMASALLFVGWVVCFICCVLFDSCTIIIT